MLILQQGINGGFRYPLVDSNGLPPAQGSLAGWSTKCQIRLEQNVLSPLLFAFDSFIDDESGVVIQYTAAQSLAWTFDQGFYDIVLIDAEGIPRQIIDQGRIKVDKIVTEV